MEISVDLINSVYLEKSINDTVMPGFNYHKITLKKNINARKKDNWQISKTGAIWL